MTQDTEAKRRLLQSHVEWLRGDHERCNPWLADIIEDLSAERDALRHALGHIDAMDPGSMIDGFSENAVRGLVLQMGGEARAALGKDKP